MFRFGALWVLALACALPLRAQDIYKCLDDRGRPLFTSDKRDTAGRKCETVARQVTATPAEKPKSAARKPSPANFPRESSADRAAAKSNQKTTLEHELSQEEAMLGDARRKLADQQAIRSGDEKNYARVLERLKPYQDTVEVHQKNVDALKRELNNLGR